MKTQPFSSSLTFIIILICSCSWPVYADDHTRFVQCLAQEFKNYSISSLVYIKTNSSYTSILKSSLWNKRFASESTPKPQVIITPEYEIQIPPIIYCAKQGGLEIRTRSGGHDFEGLSYAAQVPFVMIDLINLSDIKVDVAYKTAWIGAGATLGSLYYRIAEKSPILGFPAGIYPTVGVGGQISGGGYGPLHRKYGLAADNVVDARIIDVNGRILDREAMGEDVFWAIRGGGGASFGVIVAWKLHLVDVPEKVTVFTVNRTLEQDAIRLVHRWQYVAPKIDRDLFMVSFLYRVIKSRQEGRNETIQATFTSIFQGGVDRLLALMHESFPELGLERKECSEMSWINSTIYISRVPVATPAGEVPLEYLLNRTTPYQSAYKGKSDYVRTPIPEKGLRGIVDLLYEFDGTFVYMAPYGGRMDEIHGSATPFPHRAGNLYMLASFNYWPNDGDSRESDMRMSWSRRYYRYVTPYVSSSPRSAYFNYRDLDIGANNVVGETSYEQASIWGIKYFNENFHRLVQVKTKFDPQNFFRNEQSIPPLH